VNRALKEVLYLLRNRFDRELEEVMHTHYNLQVEENLENGMGAREARYSATRQSDISD